MTRRTSRQGDTSTTFNTGWRRWLSWRRDELAHQLSHLLRRAARHLLVAERIDPEDVRAIRLARTEAAVLELVATIAEELEREDLW